MTVLLRMGILLGIILLTGCQGTRWGEQFAQQVGYGAPPPPLITPSLRPRPAATPQPGFSPTLRDPEENTPPTPLPTPDWPAPDVPAPDGPTADFPDLDTAPFARQAIVDLAALGVWQGIPGPTFEPQLSVRRREFARWLVLANNALSTNVPTRMIRLGSGPSRPLFLDVPEDDPDFALIQALGSLGIIRGDHRQEFRPNSLLTRADLIAMKVPLDLPPGGLSGSLSELQAAWGFSDSEQIPSYIRPALIGDRQLGEESTILRVFGVIRTFNAQNPVSRAEVALALSRFHNPLRTPEQVLATPTPLPTPEPDPSPSPLPSPVSSPMPSPVSSPISSPSPLPSANPISSPLPLSSPAGGRFVQP